MPCTAASVSGGPMSGARSLRRPRHARWTRTPSGGSCARPVRALALVMLLLFTALRPTAEPSGRTAQADDIEAARRLLVPIDRASRSTRATQARATDAIGVGPAWLIPA